MRDHIAPCRAIGRPADRSLHQAEIARLPVGADDETVAQMIDLVLVVALVGKKNRERERRIVRVRVAPFRGDGALHADEDEPVGLGLVDPGVKAGIRLCEHRGIELRILPHAMALHVQAEQGLRILLDVQDRLVVVGPGDIRFDVDDGILEDASARQMLEAQLVLAAADEILAKRRPFRARRDVERADLIVVPSRGASGRRPLVAVQDDLLRGVPRAPMPHQDGVLLARLEAGRVPVAVLEVGDTGIIRFQARDDLPVELLPQTRGGGQRPFLVSVLGVQVGEHLRVPALVVPEPIIGVVPLAMRRCDNVRPDGGSGWFPERRDGLGFSIVWHVAILSWPGAGV